jgi:hypothetical protein
MASRCILRLHGRGTVPQLLLQELAKPNQARSKRGIEALIPATQIHARSLAPERELNSQ